MPENKFDTLEKAQAEILRLNEVVTNLTTERDTLTQDKEQLTHDMDEVRKHNQNLFNQLSAQLQKDEGDDGEEDTPPPTCEEFAKTLKF